MTKMCRVARAVGLGGVIGLLVGGPAAAGLVETFDTDSVNLAADYPGFALTGTVTGSVAGQQLNLVDTLLSGNTFAGFVTLGTFSWATDSTVQVDAGSSGGSPGLFNVALFLGTGTPTTLNASDNRIVFHPGFGGGALRIEGFNATGNMSVGFTPSTGAGLLNTLAVEYLGSDIFQATLTNGSNPLQTFSYSWSNPGLAAAAYKVGVGTVDIGGGAAGVFDNLIVGTAPVAAVPEPVAPALAGAALAAFAFLRRRER